MDSVWTSKINWAQQLNTIIRIYLLTMYVYMCKCVSVYICVIKCKTCKEVKSKVQSKEFYFYTSKF